MKTAFRRRVPALVRIAAAVPLRGDEDREGPLARQEVDEVGVPLVAPDLLGDLCGALRFEPIDGRSKELLRRRVELGGGVRGGVEKAGGAGGGGHGVSLADPRELG